MLRRALLLLLLTPCLARAAIATPVIAVPGTVGVPDSLVGRDECLDLLDDEISFNWLPQSSTPPSGAASYRVLVATSCPEDPGNVNETFLNGDVDPDLDLTQTQYPLGQEAVTLRDLMQRAIGTARQASCDAADAEDVNVSFCVYYFNSAGSFITGGGGRAASGQIEVQLESPPPPANVAAEGSDSALRVSWRPGTATGTLNNAPSDSFQAVAIGPGGDVHESDEVNRDTRDVTIDGLVNGTLYTVRVFAFSEGENRSAPSVDVTGTPIEILDFWELYKRQGGQEQGGCASGSAGLLALAGVALLARSILRRRA